MIRAGSEGIIDGHAGKEQAADEVAQSNNQLVVEPPVAHRDIGAEHHSCRDYEHVDNRVFKPKREKYKNGDTGCYNFAQRGFGSKAHDNPHADHPVAQDGLDKGRGQPEVTMLRISCCFTLRYADDHLIDRADPVNRTEFGNGSPIEVPVNDAAQ